MKYIEELTAGDIFSYKNHRYVLSSDFRSYSNGRNKHMSISIENGMPRWFVSDDMVDTVELFYRDKEGNILLVKEYNDNATKNLDFL
jgi:hypothetical protein